MSEFDDRINSILSNPQMMQQIMSLAQAMNQPTAGNGASPASDPPPQPAPSQGQNVNPSMLANFGSLLQKGAIDRNQQTLLKALSPYLSRQKLQKLEKAMHAAKMAGIASEFAGKQNRFPER